MGSSTNPTWVVGWLGGWVGAAIGTLIDSLNKSIAYMGMDYYMVLLPCGHRYACVRAHVFFSSCIRDVFCVWGGYG